MVESRMIRDLRAEQEAEGAIESFAELLLTVLEIPEVRDEVAALLAPPAPRPPSPASAPRISAADRARAKGGRRRG